MTRNSSVAVRRPSMGQSVFEQRIVNGLPPSRTIWHARLLHVASTNSAVITEMRNAIEPIRSRAVATLFFDSPQRRWMGRHGRRRDQRSHRALVCAPPAASAIMGL
jgi:hypothetical protein